MCNKLLQTYACGHSKGICTTPCAHALKCIQAVTNPRTSPTTIIRSNSAVSSIGPAERSISVNFSRPQPSDHSPLRVTNASSAPTTTADVPAFRFIPPSTPSQTSPVSPISLSLTGSAPPSRFPSPSPSNAEAAPEPKFCDYYIPRYLVTSKNPCVECYGKDEWDGLRARWIENYRMGHPLDRVEDVESLSGVKGVIERGA